MDMNNPPKTWCGRFGCIPISCNVNPKFINPAWLIRGFTEFTPKLWVHTLMITSGFQQNAGLTLHTPLTRCAKLRGTPSWKCQRRRLKLIPFGQKNEQRINCPIGVPPSLGNFNSWLVVSTPLKNISQLGSLFPIYGKIKNVLNHQPDRDNDDYSMDLQ